MEQIIAIIVSVIIPGLIVAWFKVKLSWRGSKLSYYVSNMADFDVQPPQQAEQKVIRVFTHSITIKNNGNQTAEDIDVCHHFLPTNIRVTPSLPFEKLNERIIRFRTLGAGENVSISYLYFDRWTPIQIHEYVRSREGYATYQSMILNPVYPNWFNSSVIVLMMFGLILIGLLIWYMMPVIIHAIKFTINYPR